MTTGPMAIDKMIRTRTMLFSSISPSKGNLLPSWGGMNQINKFLSKMAMMIVTGKASPARRSFLIVERQRVAP